MGSTNSALQNRVHILHAEFTIPNSPLESVFVEVEIVANLDGLQVLFEVILR
jgi:hypothetical protein